jgi:hypothetical protein
VAEIIFLVFGRFALFCGDFGGHKLTGFQSGQ